VTIVGGGVAGLSAALMLGRARRRVVVIDSGEPRNRFAAHLHGLLGHDGADPQQLIMEGRAEIARYGVKLRTGRVRQVLQAEDELVVETEAGEWIRSRAVIAATGVRDRLPDIPGLRHRWGRTVLHCPYCHGWEVRGQRLGVLATSPLSLHQAQLVRQWSERVTIFDAGLGVVPADVADRLRSRAIEIIDAPVAGIVGEGDTISGVRTADGMVHPVDAIFTGGVLEPLDGYLAGLDLPRTDGPAGSFLTVDATGRTGHPRIWAVGNLVNPGANLPVAISAGATAGGVINFELVSEEFDRAADLAGSLG